MVKDPTSSLGYTMEAVVQLVVYPDASSSVQAKKLKGLSQYTTDCIKSRDCPANFFYRPLKNKKRDYSFKSYVFFY